MNMEINIIAALAANNVIGADGDIPWSYEKDMRHFKQVTTGNPVIMGRITHQNIVEKLDGPLPNRRTIVLTTSPEAVTTRSQSSIDGIESLRMTTEVYTAQSVVEALSIAKTDYSDTACIAGGESVYNQFLPIADRMTLTEIHSKYDGDAHFPDIDWDDWKQTRIEKHDKFDFVWYSRVNTQNH